MISIMKYLFEYIDNSYYQYDRNGTSSYVNNLNRSDLDFPGAHSNKFNLQKFYKKLQDKKNKGI